MAMAKNNVIGKENDLPWYIPEDLKRFRELTSGGTVLMGRKTFESILSRNGKPLPNRTNVVLTRDKSYRAPDGVLLFYSVDDAIQKLECEELFVIGGGQIFSLLKDQVDKIYLTRVDKKIEGDVYFPEIDLDKWQKTSEVEHDGFSFIDYERI